MADIVNVGAASNDGTGATLRAAMQAINTEFARLSAMSGGTISGSPEGVVTASPSATRWDADAQILYLKASGTGNTGWIAFVQL
jgi:hypothetical protein